MRGILAATQGATRVLAPQCRQRADILVVHGRRRLAYDLKVNCRTEAAIVAAAAAADTYRVQFGIDRMLLVNFVPQDEMAMVAPIDRVDRFPELEIVHVGLSPSRDRYDLCFFQTNEEGQLQSVQHRAVKVRRCVCSGVVHSTDAT